MSAAKSNYTAENIQVLEGLEVIAFRSHLKCSMVQCEEEQAGISCVNSGGSCESHGQGIEAVEATIVVETEVVSVVLLDP